MMTLCLFQEDEAYIDARETAVQTDLITIQGPQLEKSDLPEKLRAYCPDGFEVFTTRQVEYDPLEMTVDADNATEFTFDDPRTKMDLYNGEKKCLQCLPGIPDIRQSKNGQMIVLRITIKKDAQMHIANLTPEICALKCIGQGHFVVCVYVSQGQGLQEL